jgi:hypothetical protein
MARDPHYDVLFEPVKIGPVTAPCAKSWPTVMLPSDRT